jgi:hypothetical protein
VQKVLEKLPDVVEKEHPAVCAEEGEPFEDGNRHFEESGRYEHGSVNERRPSGPIETSGLEKGVVEPHVKEHKSSKSSHEVEA